jgi:hypothetical protein
MKQSGRRLHLRGVEGAVLIFRGEITGHVEQLEAVVAGGNVHVPACKDDDDGRGGSNRDGDQILLTTVQTTTAAVTPSLRIG